jgi:hypothetical protein
MMVRASRMAPLTRVASSVLFAAGIGLVLIGLSAALGFTAPGVIASLAAVAALLYAGGVWFGDRAAVEPPVVLVFDRDLRLIGGRHAGEPIVTRFPPELRDSIERHCAAAVAGRHSRFTCSEGGRLRLFDAAPVLSRVSGISGVLVEGAALIEDQVAADAAVGVI